jgi:hypothetical protein
MSNIVPMIEFDLSTNPTPVPVPMLPDEIIDIKEAAFRACSSAKTIRGWCKRYGIGRQATQASPIQVSAIALEMRMCGDDGALELLRRNDRGHPMVRFYIDRVGVKE